MILSRVFPDAAFLFACKKESHFLGNCGIVTLLPHGLEATQMRKKVLKALGFGFAVIFLGVVCLVLFLSLTEYKPEPRQKADRLVADLPHCHVRYPGSSGIV